MVTSRVRRLFCALCLLATAAGAQFTSFGKNKVQFDEFTWQRLETIHFDVYFYEEERELAAFAARAAETSYRAVERQLAHTVQRRIPLILYSSHIYFEQTNVIPGMLPEGVAGFTEFLKGRVALPLSGSLPHFERVLHLAGFLEQPSDKLFRKIRRIFTRRALEMDEINILRGVLSAIEKRIDGASNNR